MTTKELIEDLKEEYNTRRANGERHYTIKNFHVFFYVNKHLSKEQKIKFSIEALFETLQYFKAKRAALVKQYERVELDFLQELTKEVHPYQILFQNCVPDAAQGLNEDDIITFIDYYHSDYTLKYFNERHQVYNQVDINGHLLYHGYVLDLIIYFQKHHPTSPRLKENLKGLKSNPNFNNHEYIAKKIDEIINGLGTLTFIKPEEVDIKPLSAKEMQSGKKWQWLQENGLKFIDQKEVFYDLIEDLSKVNYFNKHEVSPQMKEAIKLIQPKAFEAFILDIYNETKKGGNKRSGWFVGDKVIAFQVFVWLMHYLDTPNQFSILSKLAEKCFTKIPRVGPTSRKLGDVVLKILDESETIEGLGALLNLKARNKYPVFREALNASIKKAINFTKLSPNEVEDYFINDYGLVDGKVEFHFGDFRSEIAVENYSKVNLIWFKPDGKVQKSVPAKVKSDYSTELKLWKAKHKDIKKELSGQKQRLEGFWRKKKNWSFENWERYILNHELLRFLSRCLIWQFDNGEKTTTAIWNEGQLVDSNGLAATGIHQSTVSLWHPSNSTVEEVQAWRDHILTHEIKQPFKQAYREIYLVTDAEVTTSTYSNRFLNHIVRHHKFAALAKQRTWTYANVFTEHYPFIDFDDYRIRATFDLQNSYDLATTGRVHFRDTQKNEAMLMDDVPTIIFSEAMRDVDLFVGVCSIGLEEEWAQNQHQNYWRNYSTSDLSETAKTRRSVLANMIPKLKIKDQCQITDKFLRVKGKVRTYKIHLGSGNILMEPNDQYLCIVPDRSKKAKADKVFLPFDDDAIFSIILSKAFLLADDDKITDQVILNQINR